MQPLRTPQRAIRAAVLGATLAVIGVACQPGTPALIPTASFQTSVGSFAYSAAAPTWALDASSTFRLDDGIGRFSLALTDPLALPILDSPELWPPSGAFAMTLALSTDGTVPHVGTYAVGTADDDLGLNLQIHTWEDRRGPVGDTWERHWFCLSGSHPDFGIAAGTVTISQITMAGSQVKSIGLSWDIDCPLHIWSAGGFSAGPIDRWVGSATYNS